MSFFLFRPRLALLLLIAAPLSAAAFVALTVHRARALEAELNRAQAEAREHRAKLATLDVDLANLQRASPSPAPEVSPSVPSVSRAARDETAVLAAIDILRTHAGAAPARQPTPTGPHGNVYFPELFSDPHYVALFATDIRQRNDVSYAPLFQQLAPTLTPDAIARFRQLLVEKHVAAEEVDGILQNQALLEKKPFDRLLAGRTKIRVNQTFSDEIKSSFGAAVFNAWRAFENGIGARQEIIAALALRLSYSSAPLEDAQAAQLIKAFSLRRSPGPIDRNDSFFSTARDILRPPQWPALEQVRTELQASHGSSITITSTAARSVSEPPQR